VCSAGYNRSRFGRDSQSGEFQQCVTSPKLARHFIKAVKNQDNAAIADCGVQRVNIAAL